MRFAPKKKLTMSGEALARIMENTRPLPPPIVPSGKLAPAGNGTSIAPDLETPMRVARDGRASFTDVGGDGSSVYVKVPTRAHQVGDLLDDWSKNPAAQTEAPPVRDLPQHEQAVPGGWDSGGRPGTLGAEAAKSGVVPVLGGGFDITAWAIRQAGGDPYRARKQKLLDATYEERAEQRAVYTSEQLARSTEMMRANLVRLWRTIADPAERRVALFELWDECEEGEGPTGAAGARARGHVIGWIRARLPAGSTDAYSADELAKLNAARQSIQAFTPY